MNLYCLLHYTICFSRLQAHMRACGNNWPSRLGANGVEIDAHMLCAEDHLPYQGGQYSNEEFESIQNDLFYAPPR